MKIQVMRLSKSNHVNRFAALFLWMITLISCQNKAREDRSNLKDTNEVKVVDTVNDSLHSVKQVVNVNLTERKELRLKNEFKFSKKNFFKSCNGIEEHWVGGIQGDSMKHSYLFLDCYSKVNSFDVIMNPIEDISDPSEILDLFRIARDNNDYSKFRAYAFTTEKIEELEPENEFDVYEYKLPYTVDVYRYTDNSKWLKVASEKINTNVELNKLKLKYVKEYSSSD